MSACAGPADVWMLVRQQPVALRRCSRDLATAFARRYGRRFAVWHTDELLFGVRGGRLTLSTLGGTALPPPAVVCVRHLPGSMHDDREVTLLRQLERLGSRLVNPLDAQLTCRNKVWQVQELALAGLPVPDTLSYATAPLEGVVRSPHLPTPSVVKSVRGTKGGQVFLASDSNLLHEMAGSLARTSPFLFQEHVAHSHGRSMRVVVVDGTVVDAVVHTSHNGSLAANIAKGGTATRCVGRHPQAEQLALAAVRVLGMDIAGVDLLFTAEGSYTICEVNAVPGWRPEVTEVIAPAIVSCIDDRLSATVGTASPAT